MQLLHPFQNPLRTLYVAFQIHCYASLRRPGSVVFDFRVVMKASAYRVNESQALVTPSVVRRVLVTAVQDAKNSGSQLLLSGVDVNNISVVGTLENCKFVFNFFWHKCYLKNDSQLFLQPPWQHSQHVLPCYPQQYRTWKQPHLPNNQQLPWLRYQTIRLVRNCLSISNQQLFVLFTVTV